MLNNSTGLRGESTSYVSIQKAFRILELLAARSPRGVTEIADELGLEKSGVSRLLKGLAGLGYVVQSAERGQYQASPRILRLAHRYLDGDLLVREAQSILRDLAQTVRASAHLAVLVEHELVIVAKEPSPERIQVETRVGKGTPLHASALGKILLAGLDPVALEPFFEGELERFTDRTITDPKKLRKELADVRRRGFSLESEEEHPGVGCIGAPVRDSSGRWIGAMSIAGPLRGTPFRLDTAHRRKLVAAADDLSQRVNGASW